MHAQLVAQPVVPPEDGQCDRRLVGRRHAG
jgi:hypothetical protein